MGKLKRMWGDCIEVDFMVLRLDGGLWYQHQTFGLIKPFVIIKFKKISYVVVVFNSQFLKFQLLEFLDNMIFYLSNPLHFIFYLILFPQ